MQRYRVFGSGFAFVIIHSNVVGNNGNMCGGMRVEKGYLRHLRIKSARSVDFTRVESGGGWVCGELKFCCSVLFIIK